MFKRVSIFLLTTVFILAFSFNLMSPASALGAGDIIVQIDPAAQEINLGPGETVHNTLKVQNIGTIGFSFTLSVRPFQVEDKTYEPDFSTENSYTNLKNWIHFDQTEYYLEPGQDIEVPYQIVVPADVPGGGQYAAIIVETRDTMKPNDMIRTVSQLASLIYAHVSGEEHVGGVLVDHSLPNFLLSSPFTASATVKNDGNVDYRFQHTLSIKDFFTGNEVFSPETVTSDGKTPGSSNLIVLPATSRTSDLTWEGAPQLGVFQATQTITFLDQTYTYEQIVFLCPIWLAGGVVFLVVLMIIWLILRLHKRKQSRPQAF